MCEAQRLLDELYATFQRYNHQRCVQLLKIFSQVRCCECGHRIRIEIAQQKAAVKNAASRYQFANKLPIVCLVVMLLIIIFMIHLARRYNHAIAFGSCACISTLFYTNDDCEVVV
ncbi:uncharacterized protein LOC132795582 [Drosophila nasuta]|uniref:Uncharacterized protein LOC117564492 n=1 Tax=Drosophila albomicans TaxID=7291 RepID=A0A6P8XKR7_DROAB|nr:uncharacterized protein LOC117564492 [Drosophila albomicans]XP_060662360.1 uncharacterized protein LOC132795582 [Drosophila nasuta]